MRVLRTEMYFSENQIRGLNRRRTTHATNPGLGFAWLRTERRPHGIDERLLEHRWFYRDERTAEVFLDVAVRGYEGRVSLFEPQPRLRGGPFPSSRSEFATQLNPGITRTVMDGDIIVENSPPEAITFRSLPTKAPGVAIGTFVGMKAAGDANMLMLLTVPTGILVCSSAIGVSKALEKGLNKAVERLLKDTLL